MHCPQSLFTLPWSHRLDSGPVFWVMPINAVTVLHAWHSYLTLPWGQPTHCVQLRRSLPCGHGWHTVQFFFNFPCGHPLHSTHCRFCLPWGHGVQMAQAYLNLSWGHFLRPSIVVKGAQFTVCGRSKLAARMEMKARTGPGRESSASTRKARRTQVRRSTPPSARRLMGRWSADLAIVARSEI